MMVKNKLTLLLMLTVFNTSPVIKIAHRCAVGFAPENTLCGVAKSIELGADAIELDVRICGSGELVVFHDKKVDRISNGAGYIAKKTLAELKQLDLGDNQKISTLRELFDFVDRRILIDIELKGEGTAQAVAELIQEYVTEHGWSYDDFLVTAYEHHMLKEFTIIMPHVAVGTLLDGIQLDYAAFAAELGAQVVGASRNQINQNYIDDIHTRGMKVFVHVVNDLDEIAEFKAMGVDGIISDYPDRL